MLSVDEAARLLRISRRVAYALANEYLARTNGNRDGASP
jgi:hypothetical protein